MQTSAPHPSRWHSLGAASVPQRGRGGEVWLLLHVFALYASVAMAAGPHQLSWQFSVASMQKSACLPLSPAPLQHVIASELITWLSSALKHYFCAAPLSSHFFPGTSIGALHGLQSVRIRLLQCGFSMVTKKLIFMWVPLHR